MKELKGIRIAVLIAMCGLTASTIGMLTNVSGLFFTPVSDALGVGRGAVSMTLTICNLVYAATGLLTPRLMNRRSFKPLLLLGTLLTVGATAALSLARSVFPLYLLNILRGFGGGLLGVVLVTMVINNWFTQGVGLITSIALGCSGLAGALLSPVISSVIENSGWRVGYLVCAGVILLLNLPAVLLPIPLAPEDADTPAKAAEKQQSGSYWAGALFWMALLYGVCASAMAAIPQHFPGVSASYGLSASVGSLMLSVCMVTNTGGKLLFGALADRFGARRSILIFCLCTAVGFVLLLTLHVSAPMLIAAALVGFSYSMPTVGLVMMTKDAFGLSRYGAVYPKLALATTMSNALLSTVIGFLYDATQGYTLALALLLAVDVGMMALVIGIYRRTEKKQ